ncbi:bromodomain-containing protein 2-like isoform X3 [Anticarsia gemmatalis]|uniref:bromodomain-containing protein 2-like isoform X2 n=1 Tax=Anticarsia gemmatalis TaxID=129554 RepID=UPI003F76298F
MSGAPIGAGGGGDDPALPQHDAAEDDARPLDANELSQLALHINMLTGPQLSRVIHIIQSRQPSLTTGDLNEFEVDFYKLTKSTLRALQSFVRSVLGPPAPGML